MFLPNKTLSPSGGQFAATLKTIESYLQPTLLGAFYFETIQSSARRGKESESFICLMTKWMLTFGPYFQPSFQKFKFYFPVRLENELKKH